MAGANGVDLTTPAIILLDKFLTYAEGHNAPAPVEWYKAYCKSFANHIERITIDPVSLHPFYGLRFHAWPKG